MVLSTGVTSAKNNHNQTTEGWSSSEEESGKRHCVSATATWPEVGCTGAGLWYSSWLL